MPAIIIHSIEMTDEQKKVVADKFISTFSEVTNVPKDRIYLFFNGYDLNECGTEANCFPRFRQEVHTPSSMPTSGKGKGKVKSEK